LVAAAAAGTWQVAEMQKQAAANGRRFMDAYFERIKRLGSADKLESRLKFMLMDVVEQRARGWESRRKKEGPMKIEVSRAAYHRQAHIVKVHPTAL